MKLSLGFAFLLATGVASASDANSALALATAVRDRASREQDPLVRLPEPLACVCGAGCKCKSGGCPAECPTAVVGDAFTAAVRLSPHRLAPGCGGTVVSSAGGKSRVLTAGHCVTPLGPNPVVLVGSQEFQATLVRSDKGSDLALYEVAASLPAATLGDFEPGPGAAVESNGAAGGTLTRKTGSVLGRAPWIGREWHGLSMLRSTISSRPGDSGAGVFSGGKLVGVVSGSTGNNDSMAVPLPTLRAFLRTETVAAAGDVIVPDYAAPGITVSRGLVEIPADAVISQLDNGAVVVTGCNLRPGAGVYSGGCVGGQCRTPIQSAGQVYLGGGYNSGGCVGGQCQIPVRRR